MSFLFPRTRFLLICAQKTRFLLVSDQFVGFRDERASDPNSPPLETPNELFVAKTQFPLAGLLAAQFLLVVSRPIGFQVNEPHIRTY